jgi:hypothetical protein
MDPTGQPRIWLNYYLNNINIFLNIVVSIVLGEYVLTIIKPPKCEFIRLSGFKLK